MKLAWLGVHIFWIGLGLINLVSSEITFFEGENMDFVIAREDANDNLYCGDLNCSVNESCGSCEVDCGVCEVENFTKVEEIDNLSINKIANQNKTDMVKKKNIITEDKIWDWMYLVGGVVLLVIGFFVWRIKKK